MKNRQTLYILLALSLFLFNSCELLNPLLGNKTNKPSDAFQIAIERTENEIQGQHATVEIILQNNTEEKYQLGGFDLFITFDASAITFQSAYPGNFINECEWEYGCRFEFQGDCQQRDMGRDGG